MIAYPGLHCHDVEMKRRTFISTLTAASIAPLLHSPQAFAMRPMSSNGRIANDLAIVRSAMAMHPGLYLHRTPAQIDVALARFETDYAHAADTEDLARAYLALSRFLATLRCGHSYANFFNQDDADVKRLFDRSTRVPFFFRWVGNRMVILRDPSAMRLPRGTEVLALNGLTATQVLATLMPVTRADGANDGKRRSLLSVEGREDLETFDIFQGLLLPPTDGEHRLKVRLPNRKIEQRTCAPISLAERRAMMTKVDPTSDKPRWTWELRADGIAVLTMPGWAMWNSKWDWRTWLEERLDSLKDAVGLIVDIRDNEGGDDCGDPILARLVEKPISGWPFDLRLRFNEVPAIIRENSSTWDPSFYDLGKGAQSLGGGYYYPAAEETLARIAPSNKRITCPVVVLIGPVNSSATLVFIHAARATGKVTLIGETTGGNRRGVNGGAFLFVKLPFSGIEFDLPLKGYVARLSQPDAGIDPDVRVPVTVASLRDGQDEVLDQGIRYLLR